MASLREIIATFGVRFDDRELKEGNKSVETGISQLKSLAAVVASSALIGGIKHMITETANQADALAKQARAVGISTEGLQSWHHAAQLSGLQAEVMDVGLSKIQKKAYDAANGSTAMAAAFKQLGVDVKGANGELKSADQLFAESGEGLAKLGNKSEQTALAMLLFEEQGAKFVNLFAQGPEKIAEMRAELEAFGGGFTDEFATRAEEMNDNLARMDLATTSLKVTIGNFLLPVLSRLALSTAHTISKFREWAKGALEVIQRSNIIRAVITWLGAAGVAHVVKLAGGFKGLWSLLMRGIGILGRFLLKFVLPALILDDLITTFQGGDTLIRRAIDNMFGEGTTAKIVDWFSSAYDTTVQTLKDIVAAFKTEGVDGIKELFPELSDGWAQLFANFVAVARLAGELITGDWEAFGGKLIALWELLGTVVDIVFFEIGAVIAGAAASAQDIWAGAVNYIIGQVQKALKFIGAAKAAAGLEGFKLDTDNADRQSQEEFQGRLGLAEKAERQINTITSSESSQVIDARQEFYVNVPPGTDASLAQRTATATGRAAGNANRASLAAFERVAP